MYGFVYVRACTHSGIPACGCDSTHVFAVSVFRPIGMSESVHVCACTCWWCLLRTAQPL